MQHKKNKKNIQDQFDNLKNKNGHEPLIDHSTSHINQTNKETIKQRIIKSGFFAKKSLGQNFLIDRNVINKIASFLDPAFLHIVEIGPGPGILTEAISSIYSNAKILAIEKDEQFIQNISNISNVQAVNADALKCNWEILFGQHFDIQILKKDENSDIDARKSSQKIQVIGNLPYNVSVPILFSLLNQKHLFKKFIFMFQKEVADRIVAMPGTKDYGKLSVMAQIQSTIVKLLYIAPTVFWPQPKIDSMVVSFDLTVSIFDDYAEKNGLKSIEDKKFLYLELEKITSIAFQQRRKTFRSILKNAIKNNHYEPALQYEKIFQKLMLNIENRPETFAPQEFLFIAYEIYIMKNHEDYEKS